MPFQFYCPQGHLLEGHESQMGQQSQCPMCGMVFVIPVMQPQAPAGWMPGYGQPGAATGYPGGMPYQGQMPGVPGYPDGQAMYPGGPSAYAPSTGFQGGAGNPGMTPCYAPAEAEAAFPGVVTGPTIEFPPIQTEQQAPSAGSPADTTTAEPSQQPATEKQEPRIVRIACPQGHELQTPMDMIGQDVLCPFCSTQFHLKYDDSIEYKEEQAELQRRREEQLNRTALKWAIIAAVVVVLGILTMIGYLAFTAPGPAPSTLPSTTEPGETEQTSPDDDSSMGNDEGE